MKQGGIRLAAVKQLTRPDEIVARIREIYVPNHFMSDYFHIDIDDIRCGKVTVSLLTDPRKHTNHREVLHGGVMTVSYTHLDVYKRQIFDNMTK